MVEVDFMASRHLPQCDPLQSDRTHPSQCQISNVCLAVGLTPLSGERRDVIHDLGQLITYTPDIATDLGSNRQNTGILPTTELRPVLRIYASVSQWSYG